MIRASHRRRRSEGMCRTQALPSTGNLLCRRRFRAVAHTWPRYSMDVFFIRR